MATDGFAPTRRPALWGGVVALAVIGIVTGLLVSGGGKTPAPKRPPLTRVVALGDSVPYGHGLANPYLTPQQGLPASAVSQGPSRLAYPSLVAHALGLSLAVRPTNCHLTGNQLAISGAVADAADNTTRDAQCPIPPQQARNLEDEVVAANLPAKPARLVTIQAGADDIDFAACLEGELVRVLGTDLNFGTTCVANNAVTAAVTTQLDSVRASLASTIEEISPHAKTIAVLDYYQPIPEPSQIADGSMHSSAGTNLICTALKANAAATYGASQIVLAALNQAIDGAVSDARGHGVSNVHLINLSTAMAGHGICTADPWIFSAQPIPGTTLTADLSKILAAKACTGTDTVHPASFCNSLNATALSAVTNLKSYVWRVAHPAAAGQRAIAAVAERSLRGAA